MRAHAPSPDLTEQLYKALASRRRRETQPGGAATRLLVGHKHEPRRGEEERQLLPQGIGRMVADGESDGELASDGKLEIDTEQQLVRRRSLAGRQERPGRTEATSRVVLDDAAEILHVPARSSIDVQRDSQAVASVRVRGPDLGARERIAGDLPEAPLELARGEGGRVCEAG